jgi:predicted MFS family arabinose efflux permease
MGVAQSAATMARCIGPPIATTLYFVRTPLPYLIAAAIAVIAALLAWQYLPRTKPTLATIEVERAS